MKPSRQLDFLDTYWSTAKAIAQDIYKEMPNGCGQGRQAIQPNKGIKMYIVNYSDLGNSWAVEDILKGALGRSKTLEILADKIGHMVLKGRGNDVKTMVSKICTGRKKKLNKPNPALETEYLGRGHFRWDNKSHTLTEIEIKHLKNYFGIV